jgi:hypothetical protein
VVQTTSIMSTGLALNNPRMYHVVTTTAGFSNHWQVSCRSYTVHMPCVGDASCSICSDTLLHAGT